MRLIIVLVFILVVLAIVLAYQERRSRKEDPLTTLRRELAAGKITEEQFWERESALRMTRRRG